LPRKRSSSKYSENGNEFQASQVSNRMEATADCHLFGDTLTIEAPLSPAANPRLKTPLRLYVAPLSTEESKSQALLASFVHDFLPRHIRPRSCSHFFRFSYTYDLAPCYPALFNACLACATIAVGVKLQIADGARIRADEFYARSIHTLRTTIQNGGCEGTEDWLVATMIILCLYENHKPDYNPGSATVHIAAAGQVFRERARKKLHATSRGRCPPSVQTWSTLIFDRIFAESFLYNSMVVSIQDKSLSPLQDPTLRGVFDAYFEHCKISVSPEPENWPVLGMPYPLVRLLSDVVASLDDSPTTFGIQKPSSLEDILIQLDMWKCDARMYNYGLHIIVYISAAKLLAYCRLSASSPKSKHYSVLIEQELEDCMGMLARIDFTESFTRYFNWPLAVIDKVVRDPRASHFVQQKIEEMVIRDPTGKTAYDWVAEGFEQRFNPGRLTTSH
jgi:hypothetical protein